ncbi:spore coat associated protein CotJA [Brevibacillus sp. H7]|uniref:spore coat associated protein CotJA n=1 Tax=Brevibacillus sp. H7 TaxID=3349138 RepID=UPI0037FFC7BF
MTSSYFSDNQSYGYNISGYGNSGMGPTGGYLPPPPPPPPGGMLPPPPPPPPGYYRHGYPPINLPPVKPYPPDPFIDQFPLPEALCAGTLFRWLYDPYVDPYRN